MRKKTINHYQYYKQKRINQELVINKRLYLLISFIIIGMTFLIIGSSVMTLTTTPNNLTDGMEKLMKKHALSLKPNL